MNSILIIEKGILIVFYPSKIILESDILRMSPSLGSHFQIPDNSLFSLFYFFKNSISALFLPSLPFFPVNSHLKPWCLFSSFCPLNLVTLAKKKKPKTSVGSYLMISHTVKAKSLFWEAEWMFFFTLYLVKLRFKKKKKKCCLVPCSQLESLF